MKKVTIILLLFITSISFAQFKGDESKPLNIKNGILNDGYSSGSFLGFINPENFSMSHSLGLSYSTFGNNGVALGVYTNHMAYKFNDKLNVQLDASLVNSPYNSLGDAFTKSINGIYIDRAQVNYHPSKDFNVSLMFSNSPFNYYNNYGYGFGRFSRFSNDWSE